MPSFLVIYKLYKSSWQRDQETAIASGLHRAKEAKMRAFHYLLDLEREGYVDGNLFHRIGDCYKDAEGCGRSYVKAIEYYQLGISLVYAPGYMALGNIWWHGFDHAHDSNKAILPLLEAENQGVKDDRILHTLINQLRYSSSPLSDEILGRFKNKGEMALHYCDVLIQRRSPKGYYLKGCIYWDGELVPKDSTKAVSIWEEVDRLGLADSTTYWSSTSLTHAYMYVRSPSLALSLFLSHFLSYLMIYMQIIPSLLRIYYLTNRVC